MDLLFSFALGKVEKGSSPLRERRSWGDRYGLCLRDVSASQPTRALAQPETPSCETDSGTVLYLLLSSLSFPRRRGPGTESQSGILNSVGLLPTVSMGVFLCVNLLQLWRS